MKFNLYFDLILVVGFLLIISSCNTTSLELGGEKRINRPDQESWGVNITLTNEGMIRAIVKSGYLKKYTFPKVFP